MRECFCIRRSHIQIRARIDLMQLAVGNSSQFDDHVRNAERPHKLCSSFRTIRSGILPRFQSACQQKFDGTVLYTIPQEWQRANQGLKIPVVVVMTNQEELEAWVDVPQFFFHVRCEWTCVLGERFTIESMMNRQHADSRPTLQFGGKRLAGSNRSLGPVNRSLRQKRSQPCVEPGAVLMP